MTARGRGWLKRVTRLASRIAGDHYLVLLLAIDLGATILIAGRDLNSSSGGSGAGALAGHAGARHYEYIFQLFLNQNVVFSAEVSKKKYRGASRRH